jgi:hypothetical protein
MRFQPGDAIRVATLPHSEWQGAHGVILETVEHGEAGEGVQECAVQFSGERRWFLSTHLIKTVPEKLLRFFRAEVSDRWKYLNPDEIARLHGDREELIALLQEDCQFALRRAQAEVDDFLSVFHSRLEHATEAGPAAKAAPAGSGGPARAA